MKLFKFNFTDEYHCYVIAETKEDAIQFLDNDCECSIESYDITEVEPSGKIFYFRKKSPLVLAMEEKLSQIIRNKYNEEFPN
jgi:hypothetical protein